MFFPPKYAILLGYKCVHLQVHALNQSANHVAKVQSIKSLRYRYQIEISHFHIKTSERGKKEGNSVTLTVAWSLVPDRLV